MAERNRMITIELTEVSRPICEKFEKSFSLREFVNGALVAFNAMTAQEQADAVNISRGLIPAPA